MQPDTRQWWLKRQTLRLYDRSVACSERMPGQSFSAATLEGPRRFVVGRNEETDEEGRSDGNGGQAERTGRACCSALLGCSFTASFGQSMMNVALPEAG